MKPHSALSALCLLLLCGGPITVSAVAQTHETRTSQEKGSNPAIPIPTESRRLALETAGAFSNDGFRIRDAEWPLSLTKATPVFLQVTLFEGNRYWFVTGTPSPAAKIRVTLYNSLGYPVKSEQWQDSGEHGGSRAAIGFAPESSGSYFIGVELLEVPSNLPLDCSLVCAYK